MVECEFLFIANGSGCVLVLIDTWWNVNQLIVFVVKLHPLVLIDTWWNVNSAATSVLCVVNTVLIDTWWNVNGTTARGKLTGLSGFNRYMVECE